MTALSTVAQISLGAPFLPSYARVTTLLDTAGDATPWQWFDDGCEVYIAGNTNSCSIQVQRAALPDYSDAASFGAAITGDIATAAVTADRTGGGGAYYRAIANTLGTAQNIPVRTLRNLAASINGSSGGYAPVDPYDPLVSAAVPDATHMVVTAQVAGTAGNDIATAETMSNGAWGADSLSGGAAAVPGADRLTIVAVPADGMTVSIGDTDYMFVDELSGAGYEILIGVDVAANRDNLLAAISLTGDPAAGVLTANFNPAAGATVRIGDYTYTFAAAVTIASAPFTVKIGASASISLDNLIAAINGGAGAGTLYGNMTPPNPAASAAAGAGDTVDLTARFDGAAGDLVITTGSGADVKATSVLTFTPGTVTTQKFLLGSTYYIFAANPTSDATADGTTSKPWQVKVGGTATISLANLAAAINNSGTPYVTYSGLLKPNPVAEATASDATTVSVRARAAGTGGNSIATTVPSGAGFAWTSTVMAGGGSSLTFGAAQLAGGAGPGTLYGAGTAINPDVTGAAVSTNAIDVTARVAGVAGNAIEVADTLTDVKATGTLTFTPGTITTQTIRVGASYYIWAADPTSNPAADGLVTNPWQVAVGANATAALANLRKAINATGVAGTDYSTALTANASAEATASSATTLSARALTAGAGGNSISTTVPAGAGLAWGATTLTGGGGSWATPTLAGGLEAVAATGTLTISGAVSANETVTIGTQVYTFKAAPSAAGQVTVAGKNTTMVLTGKAWLNTGVPQPIAA